MKSTLQQAVITAMVTPFDRDGALDVAQARRLARRLVSEGSEGVVLGATTGEGPVLTDAERRTLWDQVLEEVGDEASVWVSAGSNATTHAAELAREAAAHGAAAVLVVTPYYNRPPQEGLYRHFAAVADATDVPLVAYDVPSRTAVHLAVETLLRLAETIPTICGIKFAHGDLSEAGELLRRRPAGFRVWSGDDAFTFPLMALGGDGVVSVASHLVGPRLAEMVHAVQAGDLQRARSLHLALLPLFRALFVTTNPIPVKAALAMVGFDVGPTRPPLCSLNESEYRTVRDALASVGLPIAAGLGC